MDISRLPRYHGLADSSSPPPDNTERDPWETAVLGVALMPIVAAVFLVLGLLLLMLMPLPVPL